MRLIKHINEAVESEIYFENINDEIHKNCKKYLKLIKGGLPLFRGLDSNYHIGIKRVRKDRKPLGMSKEEADFINKWLEKNGHSRRDKSVMAIGNMDTIGLFGDTYYFFPIGNFKYTWIKSKDINLNDPSTGWDKDSIGAWMRDVRGELAPGDAADKILRKMNDDPEDYFFSNKGFETARKMGYEIWFECDRYYFVYYYSHIWDKNKQIFTVRDRKDVADILFK
jgi:hypothetical protein